MGQVILNDGNVYVIGEHDDVPVGEVVDEWGTHQVFTIHTLLWQNLEDVSWVVIIKDAQDRDFTYLMSPLEIDSKNLPTPQRFDSYPLVNNCSLFRS